VIYSSYTPLDRFENTQYDAFHALGKVKPNRLQYPAHKFPFVINAGLSYFKGNARTVQMLRETVEQCTIKAAKSDSLAARDYAHCDDQYEINNYYAKHAKFKASNETGYGGTTMVGYAEQTGLRVLLWPRNFAWRDNMPKDRSMCPRPGGERPCRS